MAFLDALLESLLSPEKEVVGRRSRDKISPPLTKLDIRRAAGTRESKMGKEQVVCDDVFTVAEGHICQRDPLWRAFCVENLSKEGFLAASRSVMLRLKRRALSCP